MIVTMKASERAAVVLASWSLIGVPLLTSCSDYRDGTRPLEVAAPAQAHCPSTAKEIPAFSNSGQVAGAGRLPADFGPVRVVRCVWDGRYIGGTTRSEVTMEEFGLPSVSTSLMEALELPDQEFTRFSHAACPAVAHSPQFLIVIDAAGSAVRPWVPQSPCGEFRVEVARAINELDWTEHETYQFEVTDS